MVVVDRWDCNCHTYWNHFAVHAAVDDCHNHDPKRMALEIPTVVVVVDLVRPDHGAHLPVASQTVEHPSMVHPTPLVI